MIKARLKRLPPAWQTRLRRLSRLRWLEKTRIVRAYGVSFRAHPIRVGGYVLLDPEVGDFSYELDNEEELVELLAGVLAVDPALIAGYLAEIGQERAFADDLRASVRWHPEMKRKVGLAHRVAWYAIVRAVKPELVVETGIKHGLGSLVLLVALERNSRDGSAGRLISIDEDPSSGWLVPERLRERWQPVIASTFDALEPSLEGEHVDLFISDTAPEYELVSFDMRVAMRHASSRVVLIDAGGDRTTALADLARELNGEYHYFAERPRHPVYPGAGLGIAVNLNL